MKEIESIRDTVGYGIKGRCSMKIGIKLMLTFSILTAGALFVVSSVGYFYTTTLFTQSIQNEMEEVVSSHVNTLDGWLVGKAKVLETTGSTVITIPGSMEAVFAVHFSGFEKTDKEISDLYLGTITGEMLDGSGWIPPADYDPRNRPWYQAAIAANKLVYTDPYVDMTTQKFALSIAMPLRDQSDTLLGVLSEDILLETLMENVTKMNIRGQGYALLFDKKGNLLVHPDSELVMKNVLEDDTVKDLRALFTEMMAKEKGFVSYEQQGVQQMMFYDKIPVTGWTLAFTIPTEIVYQPLKELKNLFASLTFGVMVLVIGVCLFVSREITRPMINLTRAAQQIADGNLTVQATVQGGEKSKDEISILAQEFNIMAQKLSEMIGERDQAEQELRGAHDQLEEKVEIRTQELVAANQELQAMNQEIIETLEKLKKTQGQLVQAEKMSALGSLVGGMAHEINTPVGVAVTAASYLGDLIAEVNVQCLEGTIKRKELLHYNDECREASEMVLANLRRAAQLISSFKKVSIDQANEEKRTFDVKEYLADILLSLHPRLKKTKHVVTVQCAEKIKVYGLPGSFAQIITNLIMNSLTHAYHAEEAGNIIITVVQKEDRFILRYEDDGKGIDKEVLSRIFEPFFTTARGMGGSGLGLYIVYNIVTQQFGGTIDCYSEKGKGVTFVMNLLLQGKDEKNILEY